MVSSAGLFRVKSPTTPNEQKGIMKKFFCLILFLITLFAVGCAPSSTPGFKVDIPETYYLYGFWETTGGYHARLKGEIVCDSRYENAGYTMTTADGESKDYDIKARVRSLGPVYVCEFDYYEFYDLLEAGDYTVKFFVLMNGEKFYFNDEFKASPAYDVTGCIYAENGESKVLLERLDNWSPMD